MHLRTRQAVAAAASAVLTVASVVAALPEQQAMAASAGGISVAYYDQWSIYANNVTVKDLVTSGEIDHIKRKVLENVYADDFGIS